MDQRLAVEAHVAPLNAGGAQSVLVLEGVVDTIDADQPLGAAASRQSPRLASSGVRSAWAAPRSLTRSFVPITNPLRPGMRPRDRGRVQHRPRGLHHRPDPVRTGAPFASIRIGEAQDMRRLLDLRQQDRIGSAAQLRSRSSSPHSVSSALIRTDQPPGPVAATKPRPPRRRGRGRAAFRPAPRRLRDRGSARRRPASGLSSALRPRARHVEHRAIGLDVVLHRIQTLVASQHPTKGRQNTRANRPARRRSAAPALRAGPALRARRSWRARR